MGGKGAHFERHRSPAALSGVRPPQRRVTSLSKSEKEFGALQETRLWTWEIRPEEVELTCLPLASQGSEPCLPQDQKVLRMGVGREAAEPPTTILRAPEVTEAQKSTAQEAKLRETDHDTCPLPATPRHCLEPSRILPPPLLLSPSSFSSRSFLFPARHSPHCLPPLLCISLSSTAPSLSHWSMR